jgi:hypothetical protein
MIRFDVLVAALVVTSTTWWSALVTGGTSLDTALLRYLVAVPVCAIGLGFVRRIFDSYGSRPTPVPPSVAAVAASMQDGERRRAGDAT